MPISSARINIQQPNEIAAHYVYIDCLFLTAASRGHGLAEQLTDQMKTHAREIRASSIQWQTPEFNSRAIEFYGRIGGYSKSKERFHLDC